MTSERLAEIKVRVEKATKGPWVREDLYVKAENGEMVADFEWIADTDEEWTQLEYDAEFGAHAREDVPALVAEVERLQAEVPQCNGLCLRASDVLDDLSRVVGNPVARAHRSCPLHGDLENVAQELDAALRSVEAEVERLRRDARIHDELRDKRTDLLNIRGVLSPAGEERKVPFELGPEVAPAVEWLVAEVEQLRKELKTLTLMREIWIEGVTPTGAICNHGVVIARGTYLRQQVATGDHPECFALMAEELAQLDGGELS